MGRRRCPMSEATNTTHLLPCCNCNGEFFMEHRLPKMLAMLQVFCVVIFYQKLNYGVLVVMKKVLAVGDVVAVSLSMICAIHCLILPLVLVLLPALAPSFADESFHRWMVVAVVPVSIFSLAMGLRRHKQYLSILFGIIGLVILVFCGYFSEGILSEYWEENLTLIAVSFVVIGHFLNFKYCQRKCLRRS